MYYLDLIAELMKYKFVIVHIMLICISLRMCIVEYPIYKEFCKENNGLHWDKISNQLCIISIFLWLNLHNIPLGMTYSKWNSIENQMSMLYKYRQMSKSSKIYCKANIKNQSWINSLKKYNSLMDMMNSINHRTKYIQVNIICTLYS